MEQTPHLSPVKVLADGSRTFKSGGYTFLIKPDGTRIADHEDGDRLIFMTDGTVQAQYANGTRVTKRPDGTKVQELSDGSKIMYLPDSPKKPVKPTGANRRAYRKNPPPATASIESFAPPDDASAESIEAPQQSVAKSKEREVLTKGPCPVLTAPSPVRPLPTV